ncbi:MAG: ABC transporter substrate-binding protein, partial [Clostridium beijerinckii]|nr:ABC transporter substrate-binding protein [Clostridium beijerinckii]
VGVSSLGEQDTIAPAVKKGNTDLLEWLNTEIDTLNSNGFMKEAYEKTLLPAYGDSIDSSEILVEK